MEGKIKKYDRKMFIVYYGAMSHMVTTEENKTNLCNAEIQVTIIDVETLTRKYVVIRSDNKK